MLEMGRDLYATMLSSLQFAGIGAFTSGLLSFQMTAEILIPVAGTAGRFSLA